MAIVRYKRDPSQRELSPESRARIDALTPEQIEENARTDPDNPPWTQDEFDRGFFARDVRRTRAKLGVSQKEFAKRFRINLRRLQDWEQGRVAPDTAISAYLAVIRHEPELVRRILDTPEPEKPSLSEIAAAL